MYSNSKFSRLSDTSEEKNLKNWVRNHPRIYGIYKQGIFRTLTYPIRVLPDFLIIGAIKCGTSSLFNYLTQHPDINSPLRKESKFFDVDFSLGTEWYRTNFPTSIVKFYRKKILKKDFQTGESTPNYLFHPDVPERVYRFHSKIKLIIILRNPVDRAYSDYNMHFNNKLEQLSFIDAIKKEKDLLSKNERIVWNPGHYIYNHEFFPYLQRGIYINQIQRWQKFFSTGQFLILKTEDLNKDPIETTNNVFRFLGLSSFRIKNLERSNVGNYNEMDEKIKDELIDFYQKPNELLEKMLSLKFNWNS